MENSDLGRVAYLLLKDRNFSFRKGKSGMLDYLIKSEKASTETLQSFVVLYGLYEKKRDLLRNIDTIYG